MGSLSTKRYYSVSILQITAERTESLVEGAHCWKLTIRFQLGFPFFRKKISILEMEWSGNLLRKPEFRDNSGINGNRKFSGLRHVNRKNFRFTEWKP